MIVGSLCRKELGFLILFYENNWSYLSIANAHDCSKAKVRAEIDKGLSYLDGVIENLPY